MEMLWKGDRLRTEEKVATTHLWDINWRDTGEPSHLGCGSDVESAHLIQLFHFIAKEAEPKQEESLVQGCGVQHDSHYSHVATHVEMN